MIISRLPTELEVDGEMYPIDSDFRTILTIIDCYSDSDLSDDESERIQIQSAVCLNNLYGSRDKNGKWVPNIPKNAEKAIEKAIWFIDGGDQQRLEKSKKGAVIDWDQDQYLIFPAVNQVIGKEIREIEYVHWWTFLGYMSSVSPDCLFSQVMSLRNKKARGKLKDKWEKELYREFKHLVDIRPRTTTAEEKEIQKEKEFMKKWLSGKLTAEEIEAFNKE